VGGTYEVAAEASPSKLPVVLTVDASSAGVCSNAGSTVEFKAIGACTIDANQTGDSTYNAAAQAQQVVAVAAPVLQGSLAGLAAGTSGGSPSSSFTAGAASFDPKTGTVTVTESVGNPGTFSWLLTFQNGKFGVFAASAKCKVGFARLAGKCRPAKIVFARGRQAVAVAGAVTLRLKTSVSALKALRNALKQKRGLPVTATFTFQSSLGGRPVSHTQTLLVKLKKR
jgi:hypothetical protein